MKVLFPDNMPLSPELPDGLTPVFYSNDVPIPAAHLDAEVLVVWAARRRHLAAAAAQMPQLQLVQGLAAGPDMLLQAGFAPSVAICSGVGLHDVTVAEHALALILALVRRLPACAAAQAEQRWARDLGGVQELHPEGPITTLLDARVTIWGMGSIGKTLAPLLRGLGAQVRGVARSAGTKAGVPVSTDIDALLPTTDVLLMLLPETPETDRALNAARLQLLPSDAYLVNVGRGTTVDEEALIAALQERRLAGAALDVTRQEPLKPDSPLWRTPNLIHTPHAAGGRPVGANELIAANVSALLWGEPLRNLVAR